MELSESFFLCLFSEVFVHFGALFLNLIFLSYLNFRTETSNKENCGSISQLYLH